MAREKKQVALVVGASRGIGRQIAIGLSSAGYSIIVAAKSSSDASTTVPFPPDPNSQQSTINTVAREITEAGGDATPVVVDVRRYDDIEKMVQKAIETWQVYGHLDVLIYNSGAIWWAEVEQTPMKRFQLMQKVNPEGLYGTVQACLPHFRANHWKGRIIVVSPPIYSRFFRGKTAYAMGKVAVGTQTYAVNDGTQNFLYMCGAGTGGGIATGIAVSNWTACFAACDSYSGAGAPCNGLSYYGATYGAGAGTCSIKTSGYQTFNTAAFSSTRVGVLVRSAAITSIVPGPTFACPTVDSQTVTDAAGGIYTMGCQRDTGGGASYNFNTPNGFDDCYAYCDQIANCNAFSFVSTTGNTTGVGAGICYIKANQTAATLLYYRHQCDSDGRDNHDVDYGDNDDEYQFQLQFEFQFQYDFQFGRSYDDDDDDDDDDINYSDNHDKH
ncbi:hypothetical protein MBLNU459_g8352t2 [Dothideomycetes sp. NU459]